MIGLVCSLCSAMLRLDRKQDHRGTQAYMGTHTHIRCKMKGLTQISNACSGTYVDVCFSGTTEMTLYFAKHTCYTHLISIKSCISSHSAVHYSKIHRNWRESARMLHRQPQSALVCKEGDEVGAREAEREREMVLVMTCHIIMGG